MLALPPTIAVVTQPTRLQGLVARWATRSAAKFRVKQAVVQERFRQPPTSKRRGGGAPQSTAALAEDAQGRGDGLCRLRAGGSQHSTASLDRLKTELDLGYPVEVRGAAVSADV